VRIVELDVRDNQFAVAGTEPRQRSAVARILFSCQRLIER